MTLSEFSAVSSPTLWTLSGTLASNRITNLAGNSDLWDLQIDRKLINNEISGLTNNGNTGWTLTGENIITTVEPRRTPIGWIRLSGNILTMSPQISSGTQSVTIRAFNVAGSDSSTFVVTVTGAPPASWGPVSVDSITRIATSTLTFISDPGISFYAPQDVWIQLRSGETAPYTWTDAEVNTWENDITGVQTSTSKPIKALPAPSVDPGTYRFILVIGALGPGTGGQTSAGFTIGDDMTVPTAMITNNTYYSGNSLIEFFIYWSGVSESQLTAFRTRIVDNNTFTTGDPPVTKKWLTHYPESADLTVAAYKTGDSRVTSGNLIAVTVTPTANTSGHAKIKIAAEAIPQSLAAESTCIPFDTRGDIIFEIGHAYATSTSTESLSGTDQDPETLTDSSVWIEITTQGTRTATGLVQSDISISGGCAIGPETMDDNTGWYANPNNRQWRIKIGIPEDEKGIITVFISSNVVTEGNQPVSKTFEFDRRKKIAPEVRFTIPTSTERDPVTDITLSFDRRVIGLTKTDFTISGHSTISNNNKTILTTDWEIELSGSESSLLPANITLATSGTNPLTPIPVIYGVGRSPSGLTTKWVLVLEKEIKELDDSNITISTHLSNPISSSLVAGSVKSAGAAYTLRITNPINDSGTLNARLPINSVNALDDNTAGPKTPQSSGSYTFDTRGDLAPPEVKFTVPTLIERGVTTDITLSFNKRVTGLANIDFTITSHSTVSSYSIISNNNKTILTTDWEIQLGTSVSSLSHTTITLATSGANTLSFIPRIYGTGKSPSGPLTGNTTKWILILEEEIEKLDDSNITITGNSIVSGSVKSSAIAYTLRITNPVNDDGTINSVLSVNSVNAANNNILGPEIAQSSGSYSFDTRGISPQVRFTVPDSIERGTTTDITLSFDRRVTGLVGGSGMDSDFEITGITGASIGPVLTTDWEIELTTGASSLDHNNITISNLPLNPTVYGTGRSPSGPSTGNTTKWILILEKEIPTLSRANITITGHTIVNNNNSVKSAGVAYTLRITNPVLAEGTLNTVLKANTVRALDDNASGPKTPQNSGSYPFNTIPIPVITIGNPYATRTDQTSLPSGHCNFRC